MLATEASVEYRSEETFEVSGRTLPNRLVFRYDTDRWNFRRIAQEFFGVEDLETLHRYSRWNDHDESQALPQRKITKNSWEVSKVLREAVIGMSSPLLKSLIYEHVSTFAGPIRSHQDPAMMRVNFHGSKAILRFHKDVEYGQKPNAINIWLPVTEVYDSNSMYLESSPGLSDFTPVVLRYGQALMFHGYDMLHGTVDNLSGGTRITYDLRFSI